LHELFAEGERLREELHQANCSLAAAQCRLTEQEAALTAFRELHQHAIAELELERKTLRTQLDDAQTKFDEQSVRVTELESQLTAVAAPEKDHRIAELASQLQAQSEELHAARAAKDELQSAAEKSSAEWSQREQELTQRIECLERLAGNLEDELRRAAASPDKIQVAEEQRQNLEQQLSSAQRQWSEQRQTLEEQALSAHQQIQDMENQVASMRDALHSAHNQVRERDQLLSQIREEVRQQLALWQQERAQLLEQLATGQERGQGERGAWCVQPDVAQQPSSVVVEPIENEHGDRYSDRQLLAGGHALDEINETSLSGEVRYGDNASACTGSGVGNVLARLEAAGIWRDQDGTSPDQCEMDQMPAVAESQLADSAVAVFPVAMESVQPSHESIQIADAEPTSGHAATTDRVSEIYRVDEIHSAETAHGDGQTPPADCVPDEDESIENYMARLLKRVRGDAVANAFVVQQAAVATAAAGPEAVAVEATPEQAQPVASESTEFLPRKSAPEQAADVAAMRELAVSTTRQAINRFSQQRYKKSSLGTTLAACALIGLSVGLFGWAFDTGNWIAWTGCGVCLAAGIALMMRRLKMRKNAKSNSA
jgi:predicted  nucleic acid-binding Zn-ribbon protein